MRVIRNASEYRHEGPAAVGTIGNFDGLHLGHQRVIARLTEAARERGGPSIVVTFEPHPARVLAPERDVPLILSHADKLHLIERLGVDVALVIRFTKAFSATDSETFIRETLAGALRLGHVIVGPDTRFGHDRGGDCAQLVRLGTELGFTAEPVEPVEVDGRAVSSTAIRRLLHDGDVADAARLLGRFHRVRGEVIHGQQRGRTIGFPTANLVPETEVVPGHGVYAARLWRGPIAFDAVVNVGVRPTFGAGNHRLVEAHLIDFSGDLYGERVALDFHARIRPELRFKTVHELAERIAADTEEARRLLRAPH